MNSYWSEQDVFYAGRQSLNAKKQAPSKKLLTYLTEFQQDELTTGTMKRIPDFATQYEMLLEVMQNKFPDQGYRQIISGSGIDVNIPNFWELIFAMHYVTHEIELVNNIGFDRLEVEAGISTDRKIPHAEFRIVDEKLQQDVSRTDTKHQATVTLRGKVLKVALDGEPYVVWRYKTTDADTYRACHMLTQNPSKPLKRDELGLKGETSLKDLLSNMGFKDVVREIFIDHDKQNRTLTLRKSVELNDDQFTAVRQYLVKLYSGKNSVT
jgi:hypothetical protein